MGAQNLAVFRVANQLDEARRFAHASGFAISLKGELGYIDIEATRFGPFLGIAEAGDLRLAVSRARHHIKVKRHSGRAGDILGGDHTHGLGDMRQHQLGGHIADGVYVWDIGLHLGVDLDAPGFIERQAQILQPVALDSRPEADRLQDTLRSQRLRRAIGRRHYDRNAVAAFFNGVDARARHHLDAEFFEGFGQFGADFRILQRQDAVEEFHHRYVHAIIAHDVGKFHTNRAGAGDDDAGRQIVFHDLLFVCDHPFTQRCSGKQLGRRAGRDDQVLESQVLLLAAVEFNAQAVCILNGRPALKGLDLVFSHQELHALGQAIGDAAAAFISRPIIERDIAVDAESFRFMVQDISQLRIAQQRFGWDAADIQADAAPILLLDDRG